MKQNENSEKTPQVHENDLGWPLQISGKGQTFQ